MNPEEIQPLLFQAIKSKLPADASVVDEIAGLLGISTDSVYRRMKGEKQITLDEINNADAAFFCGTAAEVIGWESFNDIKFKKNWKETVSKKIQQAYSARVTEAEINIEVEA